MGSRKNLRKKGQVIYVVSVLGGIRRCHADHMKARSDFVEEVSNVEERTAATSPARVITPPVSPQLMTQPPQTRSPLRQQSSPVKSPQKIAIRASQPEPDAPSPVVQSSPPSPRKSTRTVRKPDRLNL